MYRVLFAAAGLAIAVGACADTADVLVAGSTADLEATESGLAFGFPDEEGVAAQPLLDLTHFIGASPRRVFSILVSKNGRVVYELYTSGIGHDYAHYLMSATKSVTSSLVGIAIGAGLVPSAETHHPFQP